MLTHANLVLLVLLRVSSIRSIMLFPSIFSRESLIIANRFILSSGLKQKYSNLEPGAFLERWCFFSPANRKTRFCSGGEARRES